MCVMDLLCGNKRAKPIKNTSNFTKPCPTFYVFSVRSDHAISFFLNAKILPLNALCYKLLAEMMDDVSNDCVLQTLKISFSPQRKYIPITHDLCI